MENQFESNCISQTENRSAVNYVRPNFECQAEKVSNFRRILPQVLAGTAKNLLLFDLGVVIGYQTIIIGNLLDAKNQLSFTEDESSWFASLLFIAQPIGCLFAAIFLEPIGRKRSMVVLNIPLFLGWLIISTAQSVLQLYIGSIILGLGVGFMEAPTLTYIGEITEPDIRGIMTSFAELVVGIGSIIVFLLGVWYDWRTVAYICTALPVISSVAISLIPESPIWLLAHNRNEEAEKALCWLRGWVSPEIIKEEFSELVSYRNSKIFNKFNTSQSELNKGYVNEINLSDEHSQNNMESMENREEKLDVKVPIVDHDKKTQINNDNLTYEIPLSSTISYKSNNLKNLISDLLQPKMLHSLLFILGFFFFNAANGANAVSAYTIPVFKTLGFTIDPFKANVVPAVALILGQLTLVITVYYLGKRPIALFSTLACAVSSIAIGVCAQYPNIFPADSFFSAPFVMFTINNYFYGLGLSPIPWLYLSELLPFRGRGAAAGIAASVNYLYGFFVTKTFFVINNAFSLAGFFFFYGAITIIGFIYLYFLLPETEGRTLQDIEENSKTHKTSCK